MKRLLLLFMVTILSSFVLVGCSSKEDLQTIADLQSQLEEYSALKSELDSAQKTMSDLQAQLDAVIVEKEAMSAKLEALYSIEPVEETMYTIAEAKVYNDLFDEALGNEEAGTIPAGQEVKVTGKSKVTDWYEIEMDGSKQMVSGTIVSYTNPNQATSQTSQGNNNTSQSQGNNQAQQQQTQQQTQQKPQQQQQTQQQQTQQKPQEPAADDQAAWDAMDKDLGLTEVGQGGIGNSGIDPSEGLNWQ